MGLNRILGRGDNNLGITKGMRNFPYYEFYETFREFGIPHEDLVEDVEKWTRELFNTVRCSRDYIERNNALHELEGLYKVSRSEVVEDALRKLFQDEVYEAPKKVFRETEDYEYMESIDEMDSKSLWPAILLTAGTLGSFFYLFYNN
ncbi:MAG: hypothetical protein QF567_02920 [Candidatus Pacearchaeota archaeon]|jgi:Arc/MetJ-type ribon-helix-helix transcriptional regulator|nr:hypothetical protein [Candidatus Pacearchaeota archaeon]